VNSFLVRTVVKACAHRNNETYCFHLFLHPVVSEVYVRSIRDIRGNSCDEGKHFLALMSRSGAASKYPTASLTCGKQLARKYLHVFSYGNINA